MYQNALYPVLAFISCVKHLFIILQLGNAFEGDWRVASCQEPH